MATIALSIVHSTTGMVSTSYLFSDADMDRIYRSLNQICHHELKINPSISTALKDAITSIGSDLTKDQICKILGEIFIQDILSKCAKVEAEHIYRESIRNVKPLVVQNRS